MVEPDLYASRAGRSRENAAPLMVLAARYPRAQRARGATPPSRRTGRGSGARAIRSAPRSCSCVPPPPGASAVRTVRRPGAPGKAAWFRDDIIMISPRQERLHNPRRAAAVMARVSFRLVTTWIALAAGSILAALGLGR